MQASPLTKSLLLFLVTLGVVVSTFAFAVMHYEDGENRIAFSLINHSGERVTQKDFAGRHQLVFFGFTSCSNICPVQMRKLTHVIAALEQSGHAGRITPTFISVDPQRDSPEKVAEYMTHFHDRFVGLTGSRVALESTAKSFKTFFQAAPKNIEGDYDVTHSSVAYVVDPFNRIIDYIPIGDGVDAITTRLRQRL